MVDEERKRRRVDARLGHVVHAQAALAVYHGVAKLAQVGEEGVEARGGDLLRARLLGGVDHRPDLLDAAAGEGRDAQVLGPGGHDAQTAVDGFHAGLALAVVVEQIPLIEQHDDGAAALNGQAHDLLVLFGNAHGGVDDEQCHVGAIDGAQAADHGVVLDILVHGALLANARGVDHTVVLAVALDDGIDGVARRAGNVGNDRAVGAQDSVEQRGLTGVGAADDGHVQRIGELIGDLVLLLGQQGHDVVEQVARAVAMQGRERRGLADAERIELPDAVVFAIGVVELVHQQKDRLVAALEHACDRLVLLGDAGAAIDHKQDDGGFLGGGKGLVADGRGKDVIALERLDAARVDDGELAAVPIGRVVRAVARDATGLVDDGVRGLGQAVNERGLAHVGASDDGDDRFHLLSFNG